MNNTVLIFLIPEIVILTILIGGLYLGRRRIKKEYGDKRKAWADDLRKAFESIDKPPFIIAEGKFGKSIICLYCGWESYNPNDVANKYCGHCHVFIMDKYENEKAKKVG